MTSKTTFGRTGWNVSRIGYGSMGIRGPRTWGVRVVSEEHAERVLNEVVDAGVNFVDTAPDYGLSEERIGKYLRHRRDEFYLATKCGCAYVQHDDHLEVLHEWRSEVVERNLENSLKRLQTDYVDLLQFHGGDAETLERAGLIELLKSFQEQGLIKHLGASSSIPHLAGLIDLGVFDAFQIPYSCLAPQHADLIEKAAQSGAGIIVRGGIAQGGPDAEIQRPALNDIWSKAQLDELIGEASRAEFILRYTLSNANCHTIIVGTCNLDHLAENLAAAEKGPLSADVVAEVTRRVQTCLEAPS